LSHCWDNEPSPCPTPQSALRLVLEGFFLPGNPNRYNGPRDAQGQIIGMPWSGNRVRNLWLDRHQQKQQSQVEHHSKLVEREKLPVDDCGTSDWAIL